MKTKLKYQDWIPDNENAGMNVYQAAKMLGVSAQMVKKLVREGRIPHYRVGRRIVLSVKDVKTFLESCRYNSR